MTADSGYDANTREASEDKKELPSTVTFLVTTEQSKVLAGLELDSKYTSPSYTARTENAARFIEAQDALIAELYTEPEKTEENMESEAADPDESQESEAPVSDEF